MLCGAWRFSGSQLWPSSANGLLSSHGKWRKFIYSSIIDIISECNLKVQPSRFQPWLIWRLQWFPVVTANAVKHYRSRSPAKHTIVIIASQALNGLFISLCHLILYCTWHESESTGTVKGVGFLAEKLEEFSPLWQVTVTPASFSITPCSIFKLICF